MPQFEERERGFENQFVHEEEIAFRADALAARKVALWAAGLLGRSGDDAEAYVREAIHSDLAHAGHDHLVEKLARDLDGRAGQAEIRDRFFTYRNTARTELKAGLDPAS
jgi:hypothetical protein